MGSYASEFRTGLWLPYCGDLTVHKQSVKNVQPSFSVKTHNEIMIKKIRSSIFIKVALLNSLFVPLQTVYVCWAVSEGRWHKEEFCVKKDRKFPRYWLVQVRLLKPCVCILARELPRLCILFPITYTDKISLWPGGTIIVNNHAFIVLCQCELDGYLSLTWRMLTYPSTNKWVIGFN